MTTTKPVSIYDVGLSVRTANALWKGGVKTVAGIRKKRLGELMNIRGVGPNAIFEAATALKKGGF